MHALDDPPRTRHLLPDGTPRFTNRLAGEPSPYLRQHAHNPVDWRPWGHEAFAEARRSGRPVLLSVGYATCHWCHVMEEESFEDLEIAAFINERTVPVKVDREERPDVDAVYMAAVQLFTGHGGWPMTLWLDAEGAPFYAATYLPPRDGDRGVGMGLLGLLAALDRAWREDPRVSSSCAQATAAVRRMLQPEPGRGPLPGREPVAAGLAAIAGRYDRRDGGLSPAPKFPSSLPHRLALRQDRLLGAADVRAMALHSLERMAAGGLRDQLAGGFHRYSTDAGWLVPHFEKMLYDNALLALDYLEAWQASGEPAHAAEVRATLGWMAAALGASEGGFYAATDADSLDAQGRREEGWYFTWTPEEIREALPQDQARAALAYFGAVSEGHLDGRSVLHRAQPIDGLARGLGVAPGAVEALLAEARTTLLARRSLRPPPLRDEKVLAAWNGLAIAAFARAARLLEPGRSDAGGYLARAEAAAGFVLEHMVVQGRLQRMHKDGRATVDGILEDHAFLVAGLLELFQASGAERWIRAALELDSALAARFEDPAGGYFRGASDAETLLAREKPLYDGAMPSGNAAQAHNLLLLGALTGDDGYRQRADRLLVAAAPLLERAPEAATELLAALQLRHHGIATLVLVAPGDGGALIPWLEALAPVHAPGLLVLPVVEGENIASLEPLVPSVRERPAAGGQVCAYLCQAGRCALPVTDVEGLLAQIEGLYDR
jgi:uncharacterized protein YyaL (SSP411 family)